MKRLRSRKVRWMSGVTATALALVSFIASSVQTEHDKQKVATMTARMKTVCVGRFLVDVPVEAQVSLSMGFAGGLDIGSSNRESDQEFAAHLRETEAELARTMNDEGQPSLEVAEKLVVGAGEGKTFIHNRRRSKRLKQHGYVINENLAMLSMLRFPGVSITGEIQWVAPENIARLSGILRRIRPLAPDELPRQPGFCIEHAIVQDPYDHTNRESVAMFAGFPGHPDVNLVLSSEVGVAPAPSLLERNAKAAAREPLLMRLAFTNLREGQRTVNGMQGEELLIRVREPNFTTGYGFQWETAGRQDDIHAPVLRLELESGTNPVSGGKPVQSTLSEDAMLDLWERIVSSIRLRPTGPEPAAADGSPSAMLGIGAHAGELCPQTGWWRCGDGCDGIGVHGGQYQFLTQGQRMPQALLLPQPTMWQHLRGVQSSFEHPQPTLWTLTDKRASARGAPVAGLEQAIAGPTSSALAGAAAPGAHLQAPVGSVAQTGAACPASGWWRCQDSQALDGTRWFAAGSLLPAATFRKQPYGRAADHPAFLHRRSNWQLVRRQEADPALAGQVDAGPAPAA